MKYTQVASDAFQKLQLNAGVILTDFDPNDPGFVSSDIMGSTGGGVTFEATPNFIDFGDGIDNVPADTKELKQLDHWEVKMSGTFKTIDNELGAKLCAAADVTSGVISPRSYLKQTDFFDVWWVGDYSDVNTGDDAGYIAIEMKNVLSTGGLKVQSNDKEKGDFAFEFTAHSSLENIDLPPYNVYIEQGISAQGASS